MNEEPFGPLAVISPFSTFDEVVTEANRLPYGLASYAYTRSAKTANAIAAAVESGMISINHHGLALAGSAVRRGEGFGLRLRRRAGGDRELSQHEVRHAGRPVSRTGIRGATDREHSRITGCDQDRRRPGSAVETIDISSLPPALVVRGEAPPVGRAGASHEDLGIQHKPALLHHRNVPLDGRTASDPEEARDRVAGQHRPRTARCRGEPGRTARQGGQAAEQGARRTSSPCDQPIRQSEYRGSCPFALARRRAARRNSRCVLGHADPSGRDRALSFAMRSVKCICSRTWSAQPIAPTSGVSASWKRRTPNCENGWIGNRLHFVRRSSPATRPFRNCGRRWPSRLPRNRPRPVTITPRCTNWSRTSSVVWPQRRGAALCWMSG